MYLYTQIYVPMQYGKGQLVRGPPIEPLGKAWAQRSEEPRRCSGCREGAEGAHAETRDVDPAAQGPNVCAYIYIYMYI